MTGKSKSRNLNILINNAVPLNNGDVALFISLYRSLVKEGFTVQIAAYHYKLGRKFYPNLPLIKELGQNRIFVKLPILKQILLPFLFLFSKPYRNADIIIGVPGGYINSNYSIKNSLLIYKIAKFFKKRTAIYSQSVGPFSNSDSVFFKRLMSNSLDYIFVRDNSSYNLMTSLNISKDKFKLTKDAAFLLDYQQTKKNNLKKVVFSVREWNFDNRKIEIYKRNIVELVKITIDNGYTIDFLSTCQGVGGYKNDAKLAKEIYDNIAPKYQSRITVLNNYYLFDDFYQKLEDYEFVVGTRLHMCIMAFTKMIPAFNISYEVKGKECYNYLGFSEYSIDYNEDNLSAVNSYKNFIKKTDEMRKTLNRVIPTINKESKDDFQIFLKRIIEN